MPTFQGFVCCCGAKTLFGVVNTKPEAIIRQYLQSQMGGTKFDPVTKKYVKLDKLHIMDAFVIWADPDRPDPPKGGDAWHQRSSGKLLAAYITQQRLGSVTKTPLRHNPMHPERKPGKLDLRIWIWNINPVACQKWWDRYNPPPSAPSTTASLLDKVPPADVGKKNATPVCPDDDIPF